MTEALHDARGQADELKRRLHETTGREDSAVQRVAQLEAQVLEALAHSQAADDVAAAQQAQAAAQGAAADARAAAEAQIAHVRWAHACPQLILHSMSALVHRLARTCAMQHVPLQRMHTNLVQPLHYSST